MFCDMLVHMSGCCQSYRCRGGSVAVVLFASVVIAMWASAAAAQIAGDMRTEEVARFAQNVSGGDVIVQRKSLEELTFESLDGLSVFPLLRQALEDRDLGGRGRAARAISQLPPNVLPALLQSSQDPSPNMRIGVIAAITALDVPTSKKLPVLLRGLQDNNVGVRMQAAWGIGLIGPDAQEGIPLLSRMVKNGETDLRVRAVQALRHLGWKVKEAVFPIGLALSDIDEKVRMQAARALAAIGPNAVVVLPAIVSGLQDPNPMFQSLLIEAVDTIGPEALPAVPALLNMLKSTRFQIRMATIKALKRIEGTSVPSLRKAARGDDSTLRLRALEVLLSLNELGKDGLPNAKTVELELIGAFPPDISIEVVGFKGDHSSQARFPLGEDQNVCRHIAQLRKRSQLDFEYPNENGPDGFSKWLAWKWPSGETFDGQVFGTETDIDDDGAQELLLKWWSWGPHMYHRTEYVYVLSGKDLSPYFMKFEDVEELAIASTSGFYSPLHFDRSSISDTVFDMQGRVSEYARINPFWFKGVHYILVDVGDMIVSRYRAHGRLQVMCSLSEAKSSKKKRS